MLKIITWNVQGLRTPNKRMRVLRHLKRLKADIALLQETHLENKNFFRLKKLWVEEIHGSAAKGKKGGVSTLIHKCCPYTTHLIDKDEEGIRVMIALKLQETTTERIMQQIYMPRTLRLHVTSMDCTIGLPLLNTTLTYWEETLTPQCAMRRTKSTRVIE